MKKLIFTLSTFIFSIIFSFVLNAQEFRGLDVSPMDVASFPSDYKISDKIIKVTYSRPQLKERALDKLVPNGKIWRTGANEATEITFYKDLKLANTLIKSGTYTMVTIPNESEWTIILSKDLNVWGAYFYNETNDIARIKVPVNTVKDSLEAFSIIFEESKDGVDMYLGWGTVRVKVPFKN